MYAQGDTLYTGADTEGDSTMGVRDYPASHSRANHSH